MAQLRRKETCWGSAEGILDFQEFRKRSLRRSAKRLAPGQPKGNGVAPSHVALGCENKSLKYSNSFRRCLFLGDKSCVSFCVLQVLLVMDGGAGGWGRVVIHRAWVKPGGRGGGIGGALEA